MLYIISITLLNIKKFLAKLVQEKQINCGNKYSHTTAFNKVICFVRLFFFLGNLFDIFKNVTIYNNLKEEP